MDNAVFNAMTKFAKDTPSLNGFVKVFTTWGVVLLAVLILLVYLRGRFRDDAVERLARVIGTGLAAVVAYGISEVIKEVVKRPRPWTTHLNSFILAPHETSYSFPSNHAIVVGAVIMGLWLSRDVFITFIATIDGLLVAASRLYLGAHYFSDVIVGLLLGLIIAAIVSPLTSRLLHPTIEKIADGKYRKIVTSRPKKLLELTDRRKFKPLDTNLL
jgi:membrane-associated phospholipid phosphatase